jgi:hypothetical protein
MKHLITVPRIAIVLAIFLLGFMAWRGIAAPATDAAKLLVPASVSIALLLPDDLAAESSFVRMWQDSADEEGIRLQPVRAGEWARSTIEGLKWEGVILPDTFHRRVDDSVAALLRDYVSDGGRLMLVYDGGLLTSTGFYSRGRSRFSELAGVEYGMYQALGKATATRSRIARAQASDMKQLHIPPGRFASETLTFPPQDGASDYPALIFDYSKQPQSFATIVTRGRPTRPLMVGEDGGILAARHKYGKGETLFVNFPLTYLKQRTDGIFLHSFLHYFAADMLQQPRLAGTPDGKGGIILNWHVDAKPALPGLAQLQDAGIFSEGPFSFHFTAGPDVNVPGDAGGLNVPKDPQIRALIRSLVAQGHAMGDHGGWIHNYFGNNVDAGNQAAFEQYLTLNHQAMTDAAGVPPREYSTPVGNQPPWVTRWLEQQGFAGYYQTGNIGMGPTRAWLDSERMSALWAFPVLTLGPVATAEDAYFQHIPPADYENWLNEVARFVERERALRLVYFHPPGAVLYLTAVRRFVNSIKTCREAGNCQWLTMGQAADFMSRRERIQWRVDTRPDGPRLVAEGADLSHMTWWLPRGRFAKPVVVEGRASVDESDGDWRVTAAGGNRLGVSLKLQ